MDALFEYEIDERLLDRLKKHTETLILSHFGKKFVSLDTLG
jgi:hypothetical protein